MKDRSVTVYTCSTSWDHEIESTDVKIWPSIELMQRDCKCIPECGIVELKLTYLRMIDAPKQPYEENDYYD
jgi:hypothetical protein